MKEFIVVHIVNKADGTASIPGTAYDTETEARKAFYRLCGQAVDSDYVTDTVVLMTKFGDVIDKERFDHRAES